MIIVKFILILVMVLLIIVAAASTYMIGSVGYEAITEGNIGNAILNIIGTIVVGIMTLLFVGLLIDFATTPLLIDENPSSPEYETITNKLEANPFDEEALIKAIEYNLKVEGAEQFDSYNLENKYEDYINEPYININELQIEYIDEHYGLENILEKYKEEN